MQRGLVVPWSIEATNSANCSPPANRVHHGLRGHASRREQRARALYRPLRKSAAPATDVLRSTRPTSGLMASKGANEEIGVITPSTSSMPTWKSDGTVNRISDVSDPGPAEKMSRSNVVESRDPTRELSNAPAGPGQKVSGDPWIANGPMVTMPSVEGAPPRVTRPASGLMKSNGLNE